MKNLNRHINYKPEALDAAESKMAVFCCQAKGLYIPLYIQSNTMETVTLKMEDKMLEEIDRKLGEHRYSTRTEFIRDAIREKLSELEKETVLRNLAQLKGSSKRKTSDAQLHAARDKAFEMLEKKFNIK